MKFLIKIRLSHKQWTQIYFSRRNKAIFYNEIAQFFLNQGHFQLAEKYQELVPLDEEYILDQNSVRILKLIKKGKAIPNFKLTSRLGYFNTLVFEDGIKQHTIYGYFDDNAGIDKVLVTINGKPNRKYSIKVTFRNISKTSFSPDIDFFDVCKSNKNIDILFFVSNIKSDSPIYSVLKFEKQLFKEYLVEKMVFEKNIEIENTSHEKPIIYSPQSCGF